MTQYCGAAEDPRFEYEEGCDTIDIPYGTEKCYCRTGDMTQEGRGLLTSFAG